MRDLYGMINVSLTEGLDVRFAGKIRKPTALPAMC